MGNTKLIEVKLDGILEPRDLGDLLAKLQDALPPSTPSMGVIISGRLPVWAFCAIAHLYHPAQWVATYDPRTGGAVVVMSHSPEFKVGDVVHSPTPELINVEFNKAPTS